MLVCRLYVATTDNKTEPITSYLLSFGTTSFSTCFAMCCALIYVVWECIFCWGTIVMSNFVFREGNYYCVLCVGAFSREGPAITWDSIFLSWEPLMCEHSVCRLCAQFILLWGTSFCVEVIFLWMDSLTNGGAFYWEEPTEASVYFPERDELVSQSAFSDGSLIAALDCVFQGGIPCCVGTVPPSRASLVRGSEVSR